MVTHTLQGKRGRPWPRTYLQHRSPDAWLHWELIPLHDWPPCKSTLLFEDKGDRPIANRYEIEHVDIEGIKTF